MKKKPIKRRRNKEPDRVGDILAKMVTQTRLGKQMDFARVWQQWPEVAGATLSFHGRPHGVRKKVLVIEVDSTVWMNRFSYQKWDIVQRINTLFGREVVSDIFLILTPDAEQY